MTNSTTTQQSINAQAQTLPAIAGHEITMDEYERFNLNAIHHAAGGIAHKRPSQWARRDEAKELIAELFQSADLHFDPIHSVRGGAYKGTYAHELLAISYAGWISPKFQLQVNQVFLDYRMSRPQKAAKNQPALPTLLTPSHQRSLQRAIARRVQVLPEEIRRSGYSRIYSHLKDRFGVAKYDQIEDAYFTEALGAVESVSLEGEWLAKSEALPDPENGSVVLSEDAVASVAVMSHHVKHAHKRWQMEIGPALKSLGSPHANEIHEHLQVAAKLAHKLQRATGLLPPGY